MELVLVMVIISIMAAVVVPSMVGVTSEARIASLTSLAGTVESAGHMTKGAWEVQSHPNNVERFPGDPSKILVIPETAASKEYTGWPQATATGIGNAIALDQHGGGFLSSPTYSSSGGTNTAKYEMENSTTNCFYEYSTSASSGTVNSTITSSGC